MFLFEPHQAHPRTSRTQPLGCTIDTGTSRITGFVTRGFKITVFETRGFKITARGTRGFNVTTFFSMRRCFLPPRLPRFRRRAWLHSHAGGSNSPSKDSQSCKAPDTSLNAQAQTLIQTHDRPWSHTRWHPNLAVLRFAHPPIPLHVPAAVIKNTNTDRRSTGCAK